MKKLLQELVKDSADFLELRYHKRLSNSFVVQKGRVDVAGHSHTAGVAVRAVNRGNFGFAGTCDLTREGIARAIREARQCAATLAALSPKSDLHLSSRLLAVMDHTGRGTEELLAMGVDEKLSKIIALERDLAASASHIQSARCRYQEIIEEKVIVTSDGAAASLKIAQPEISLSAIAEKDGQRVSAFKGAGVTGGWSCLMGHPTLEGVVAQTAKLAIDLLHAKHPKGGKKRVILDPALVGMVCHEAIGHTVEADFVKSGSVAQGRIGTLVASPLVTMYDTGMEDITGMAACNIPFDDEGVLTSRVPIITAGVLTSYLHNRESAGMYGVSATGNARAWSYKDEPIIRMRNTYLAPGQTPLEQMIAELNDGYLVEGASSGQADSNGEFMFGCSHVWHIKKGKKVALMREATLSGIAFDVLQTVDAVSQEFRWDLGTGYCGKGQPAKVDAGGPFIRCLINIGGRE